MENVIKFWVILKGTPLASYRTRQLMRNALPEKKKEPKHYNEFLYTGKVIQRGTRQYLILEI